jgi:hypothetical protein
MKSIVIHAAHDLRIEERPVPRPDAGQVQIELALGGISGPGGAETGKNEGGGEKETSRRGTK